MAARSIINFVAIFPNLDYDFSVSSNEFVAIDPSKSYYDAIKGDSIVTLSTNSAVDSPIQGLLYVPDLDPTDQCANLSLRYVPKNATRQANLPSTDYNIIAMAPWINKECTESYLASASLDPIRAFIFYHPDNQTTLPSSNDSEAWTLHDGGSWKRVNQWPIYGVSGAVGERMMAASSKYSGNLSSVPYGQNLSMQYDIRDYVRIYTQIYTNDTTSLPKLWIFLLVIVACLIVILTFISISWHWLQKQRRESLRRRVAAGRVDLEALGITRLTVPDEFIKRLPLYIYTCDAHGADIEPLRVARLSLKKDALHDIQGVDSSGRDLNLSLPPAPVSSPSTEHPPPMPGSIASKDHAVAAQQYRSNYQPGCPICMDDFDSWVTIIRELPCGHIFHPECIDSFLTTNSSLCPLCMKSVLPPGCCPTPITNAMVRRERMVRRIRTRVNVETDDSDTAIPEALRRRLLRFGQRIMSPRPPALHSNVQLRTQDNDERVLQPVEE